MNDSTSKQIQHILNQVQTGEISVSDAYERLKLAPFEDLGYAKLDHHRSIRQGTQEVIFGEGKTSVQILGIVQAMLQNKNHNILITRLDSEKAKALESQLALTYDPTSRIGIVNYIPPKNPCGNILIATAGTSDIPVAEEAALTARLLGSQVTCLYDVGVSGIHRLLSHTQLIANAKVIIAIAGMEGALASVIGGLADCPVIAVPTSIGYGASFQGVAALLSMLNSCASGVSVVNIDNGFGAGYLANMINQIGE